MVVILPPDETEGPSVTPGGDLSPGRHSGPSRSVSLATDGKGDGDERGTAGASRGGARAGDLRGGSPGRRARQDLRRGSGGAPRRLVRGPPGRDVRAPRPERRREVDDDRHPDHDG